MKKTGIFILVSITLVFAAFLAGFYVGRNYNRTDIQISTLPQTAPSAQGSTAAPSVSVPSAKININTADLAELESLPKIGPKLAQRIIDYRLQYGHFRSLEDLRNVEGIGDGILEAIKDYITL